MFFNAGRRDERKKNIKIEKNERILDGFQRIFVNLYLLLLSIISNIYVTRRYTDIDTHIDVSVDVSVYSKYNKYIST